MRDPISFQRASALHPAIRQEVIKTIDKAESNLPTSARVRIVQGMRTIEEQQILFNKGRTTPGTIVTNARPGQSFHNYGLAIDFAMLYDKNGDGVFNDLSWDINYDFDKDGVKDWMEVVLCFKAAAFVWGGDFKSITDNPHLEKTFGYTWRELLDRHRNNRFINGSKYVLL
ncbi:MAG: M15 family metallopeptidase [Bacteroidota bacterium]